MVYESLLLWPERWFSILLTVLFFFIALLNVVFTSFIAYEQITMFQKELRSKEESMRVQRFLTLKDRPLSGFYLDESQLKVELTYPDDKDNRKEHFWTIFILLVVNACISMIPGESTAIIVTLVGAFTSPLVVFMLPGYLYFDHVGQD